MAGLEIALRKPYSVEWVLAHIRASSYGVPYTDCGGDRLRRVVEVVGETGLVEFGFHAGDGGIGHLDVRVLDGDLEHRSERLEELARFIFGVDDDLSTCYRVLNRDARMKTLVARYRGLRLVKAPSLYEALLITVLGQQVSVYSAQSVRRRLMEHLSLAVDHAGTTYRGIPDAERLAESSAEALRDLGVSRQKARYLVEIARREAEGELQREAVAGLPDAEAMDVLQEIPGVGRWTAEIVLMRGDGRMDLFSAGDLGLQVAAQKAFGLTERPTEEQLREMAEAWSGWRSYAAFYLWMTLMEAGQSSIVN
ncbi:MAG: DNA-3-methyladenine glycosylase [Candidatus Latescibacteria bacterium]|jgi:DNA-3-methyladenine glycosylase II|nr:DNA-3-methyladenine glycosylase [Candidatus Latescibacterota bacterium]